MCDTFVVVRPDRVLFGKNSDRDANEGQLLDWQPAAVHTPDARVQCTWIDVPQARETLAVLVSRPFWMWGAEVGTNEAGVTIGNEAVFTREPYAKTGLLGMDLLRLALERSESAESAVEVIVELLERHGQGGGCGHESKRFTYHNSFLIADAGGAFVLETAGQKWDTERVTVRDGDGVSDGVRAISNGLTIPAFRARYSDRVKTPFTSCGSRRARTQAAGARAEHVGDVMRALRDHGAGQTWPVYARVNGALSAPCVHGGGLLAASQTTASWVAELRAHAARHWATATAAPCVSLFKPVQVATRLDLGPPPADRVDASLWWRHEQLHRRLMRDPERLANDYVGERDALEARWLDEPPPSDLAFKEGEAFLDRWLERTRESQARDVRPAFVRRYWRARDERAGIVHAS